MSDRLFDPNKTNADAFTGDKNALRLEILRYAKEYSTLTSDEEKELIKLERQDADPDRYFLDNLWNETATDTPKTGYTETELAAEIERFSRF